MTVFYPEGVSSQGNESLIFVPTLANPAAPKVSELTGAGAINLSFAARGFEPQSEQASVPDVRLGSRQTFETPGRVNKTLNDITYVYDPQGEEDDPDNVHYDAMKRGVTGYLVDRRGLDAETVAVAAAQKVDVYPVQLGDQRRVAIDPSAEGGKFEVIQKPFVTGLVREDAVVVAGP